MLDFLIDQFWTLFGTVVAAVISWYIGNLCHIFQGSPTISEANLEIANWNTVVQREGAPIENEIPYLQFVLVTSLIGFELTEITVKRMLLRFDDTVVYIPCYFKTYPESEFQKTYHYDPESTPSQKEENIRFFLIPEDKSVKSKDIDYVDVTVKWKYKWIRWRTRRRVYASKK